MADATARWPTSLVPPRDCGKVGAMPDERQPLFKTGSIRPTDSADRDDAPVQESEVEAAAEHYPIGLLASLLRYAGLAAAFYSMSVLFAPYVPPTTMRSWSVVTVIFMAIWLASIVAHYWIRPSQAFEVRRWNLIGKCLLIGTGLIIITMIWAFLPGAPEPLHLLMIIFVMAYLSITIISAPQHAAVNRFAIIAMLGSIVIVHDYRAALFNGVILVFVLLFAAIMFFLSKVFPDAIKQAAQSRAIAEAARSEAERQRDAKGRFLASASHDLGQPLQSARLFFDQVARGTDPALRASAVMHTEAAFALIERRLRQMIEHLRLESADRAAVLVPLTVGHFIARTAALAEAMAAQKGIALHSLPSSLQVLGDVELLERALLNLVDNGLRHSQGTRLLMGARRRGASVRIWVIDDGSGIAAEDVASLFDDYFQGSNHGDEVRGGFGLGLASVQRTMALMNGKAGLDPNWTSGAAFFLELQDAAA
ncbi:sensor histidine kinase [Sphingopyxis sp. R3-92]|uniref:sensor histidine kinase n=1 Tax=Sphingopyxis sp. R3-92 TaxID=3158553 RepID=UPI003EE6F8C9